MSLESVHLGPGFAIDRIITGPLDNNVLIACDEPSRAAIIIDAASEPDRILDAVDDLDVVAVVTTHGHADHHGAAEAVSRALDVPVLLHPADHALAGLPFVEPLGTGPLTVGRTGIEVVHTPGHTPGSVCLLLDGVAITGDTLFPGGPGATRFPYSDFDRIIASITDELFVLPGDTVVLPGHGASTTIGSERPQLQDWIDRRW